jgi:hypothetical protein
LYDVAKNSAAPIAEEGLKRIAELYAIEANIKGASADGRLHGRTEHSTRLCQTNAN